MAVLASNITWNAYNNFGGRSNYINADVLPPRPTVNSRQELKRYIRDQKPHHRRITFQDEYRKFLKSYGSDYDERYVWD